MRRKQERKRKILKRLLQIALLGLLLAVLAGALYVAAAATKLMKKRSEQAARASSIAEANSIAESSRAAAMQTTVPRSDESAESTVPTETDPPETTTEEETDGFSFIDLFDPDLFKETETEQEGPADYASLAELYASEKRIWMGDSRFVGLSRSVSTQPNDVFISKGAMAYDWFCSDGLAQLMQELAADPHRIVIINFGLNDCANNTAGWHEYFVEDYVETINNLTAIYPDTKFYFASVGLINGDYNTGRGFKLARDQVCQLVDIFNDTMHLECLAEYIDLSEYLMRDGYNTVDGVHFDSATNQKIYNYCVAKTGSYR